MAVSLQGSVRFARAVAEPHSTFVDSNVLTAATVAIFHPH